MKRDRETTHYFPTEWTFGDCRTWLLDRGIDILRGRWEYAGPVKQPCFAFELAGSEQHERTTNWFG